MKAIYKDLITGKNKVDETLQKKTAAQERGDLFFKSNYRLAEEEGEDCGTCRWRRYHDKCTKVGVELGAASAISIGHVCDLYKIIASLRTTKKTKKG